MKGRIAGATARDRAVALAGALAEAGVTSLELNGEALGARATDLPGRLCDPAPAGGRTLRDPERGFEARFGPESCEWAASDPDLGAALADISVS